MTSTTSQLKTAVVLLEKLDPGIPGVQLVSSREEAVLEHRGAPCVQLERLPPGSPRTLKNLQKLPLSQRYPQVLLERLPSRHARAPDKNALKELLEKYPLVQLERLPFFFDQTSEASRLCWQSSTHGRARARCPSLSEGAVAAKKASARKAPQLEVP